MKKIITILLIVAFFSTSNAQQFNKAIDYLEFIKTKQKPITKNSWKYSKKVAHSKNIKAIKQRKNVLIRSIEKAIKNIESADGYDGDEFKNKVLANLKLNKAILNDDYSRIIDLKEVAEKSYDKMEAYFNAMEMADKKMAEFQTQFESDYYDFANKHNINIIKGDSELGKKIQISNEVFKNYNKVFLRFFKVQINEISLMEALNKKDLPKINEYLLKLNATSKEGLNDLPNVELYKGDKRFVQVLKKAFEFFEDEATNKIPKLVEFNEFSNQMEKDKVALEKTPANKRTKDQVDNYNNKIKVYNNKVKEYNQINNDLNTKRNNIINLLNTTREQFYAKYIPKD